MVAMTMIVRDRASLAAASWIEDRGLLFVTRIGTAVIIVVNANRHRSERNVRSGQSDQIVRSDRIAKIEEIDRTVVDRKAVTSGHVVAIVIRENGTVIVVIAIATGTVTVVVDRVPGRDPDGKH